MHIGIAIVIVAALIVLHIAGYIAMRSYLKKSKRFMTKTYQQVVEKLNFHSSEIRKLDLHYENLIPTITGLKERIEKLEERE